MSGKNPTSLIRKTQLLLNNVQNSFDTTSKMKTSRYYVNYIKAPQPVSKIPEAYYLL